MDENKDKKPITERVEDALDEAVYKAQNAIYGEKNGSGDGLTRWKIRASSVK